MTTGHMASATPVLKSKNFGAGVFCKLSLVYLYYLSFPFLNCLAEAPKAVISEHNSGKVITSEISAPLGEMVVLNFSKSIRGNSIESIKVFIEPKERADKSYISADKTVVCIPTGLKPVDIVCTLVVAKADIPDYTRIIIRCGQGDIPPPPPDPTPPNPNPPDPSPSSRNLFVIVVEESGFRTLDTAIVLNSIAFWNDLKLRRHDWIFYDKDTSEPYGKKVVQEINSRNVKFPALVIKDLQTDKTLEICPLPKSTKEIDSILKKYSKN